MSQQFSLSDEFIAQVAKLLQMAMLTGTSIGDNMRMLRVTPNEDAQLVLTEEYKKNFEDSITKMLAEAEAVQETMRNTIVQS
jgi:hypothetical protein